MSSWQEANTFVVAVVVSSVVVLLAAVVVEVGVTAVVTGVVVSVSVGSAKKRLSKFIGNIISKIQFPEIQIQKSISPDVEGPHTRKLQACGASTSGEM